MAEEKKKCQNAIIPRFYSINGETPDKSILETFHFGAEKTRADEGEKNGDEKRQHKTRRMYNSCE